MRPRTVALAIAALLGVLVAISALLTVVSLVVGLVTALVLTVVALAVLLLALVGSYRVFTWWRSRADATEVATATRSAEQPVDPIERLRERYVAGELTESEYERRLELVLDTDDLESIDRRRGDRERDPSVSRRS